MMNLLARCLRVFVVLLLLGTVSGCRSAAETLDEKPMLDEVWTKNGWPPRETQKPPGFKVSPREALKIVADTRKLSLKHRWICFHDDKHYYIADTFGKSANEKTAMKYGIKVNGVTGAVE